MQASIKIVALTWNYYRKIYFQFCQFFLSSDYNLCSSDIISDGGQLLNWLGADFKTSLWREDLDTKFAPSPRQIRSWCDQQQSTNFFSSTTSSQTETGDHPPCPIVHRWFHHLFWVSSNGNDIFCSSLKSISTCSQNLSLWLGQLPFLRHNLHAEVVSQRQRYLHRIWISVDAIKIEECRGAGTMKTNWIFSESWNRLPLRSSFW